MKTKKKKSKPAATPPVRVDVVEHRIHVLRGCKVMLSHDLAELYRVEPRALVQAVKRNIERFPDDFMFQVTAQESEILKSQFVISRWGGRRRALPYAFTEQGVAMLSSVLKSRRAIHVNITIVRAFIRMRNVLAANQDLARRIEDLERKFRSHEARLVDHAEVFEALKKLLATPDPLTIPQKHRFGFPTSKTARAVTTTAR